MDKGRPALFSLQRNVTESLLSFSVPLMTLGDNSVSPCRFVRDRAGPGVGARAVVVSGVLVSSGSCPFATA